MRYRVWVYLALGAITATPPAAHGQQTIFLLRHAERAEYETPDGPLSEAGIARAHRLRHLLKDAGVTAIFTSERQRTIQTAQPLAAALNLPLTTIGGRTTAEQVHATISQLRRLDWNDVAVVVGHQNTVAMILKALANEQDFGIGSDDSLLVITKLREWDRRIREKSQRDTLLAIDRPAGMPGAGELRITDHEHDDLFVIVRSRGGSWTILHLNY